MSDHIFISYKTEQRPLAVTVRDKLHGWGYNTWLDVDRLQPGTYWANDIDQALKTCRACVGVMTPHAIRSRYVTNEWDMAIMQGKLFVPLMFEPTEPHYKYIDVQYVDFTRNDPERAYTQLRERLAAHRPGAASPLPNDPYADYLQQLYDRINKYLAAKLIPSLWDETGRPEPIRLTTERTENAVDVLFEKREEIDPLFAVGGITPGAAPDFAEFKQAFDYYDGRVLLLGEPGAGKTITLLHYGRDAVVKRRQDPTAPLPTLGIIPTWNAEIRPTITQWLSTAFGAPPDAQAVIDDGQALLLLDGLDELGDELPADAPTGPGGITDPRLLFLQTLPDQNQILLTCRTTDYAAIGTKVRLRGAVTLRSLNEGQLAAYLHRQPELRDLVAGDRNLQAWLDTPLLLSYFAFAYERMDEAERHALRDIQHVGDLRDRIFAMYMTQLYERETRKFDLPVSLDTLYDTLGLIAAQDVMGYQYGAPENVIVEADFERVLPMAEIDEFRQTALHLQLLDEIETGTYRFIHTLLRDYFAYTFASRRESITIYPQAYRVLARLGDLRALPMLMDVGGDQTVSGKTRAQAIRAIGHMQDERATAFLLAHVEDDAVEVRQTVANALGYHPVATMALLGMLDDANAVVRGRAARSLGRLNAADAVDAIAQLLDDTAIIAFNLDRGEVQVRSAAVEALRAIGTPEALAHLDNT